jgi:hypothetical protein
MSIIENYMHYEEMNLRKFQSKIVAGAESPAAAAASSISVSISTQGADEADVGDIPQEER